MLHLTFLGCGRVTALHSRTLAGFRGEVACAYASREPEKARAYAARFGGTGHFGSYEAALEDARADAVLVATPPSTHLDLAVSALRAGKHVILEKPPLLRSADFEVLRRAQAESGRRVLVAENYYYKPLAERLRQLLREGVVGEVLFVYVNALKTQATGDWRDDAGLAGGGALFEGGIHWVNFVSHLGPRVRAVRGFRPGSGAGVERSMQVALEYEEGAVGTLLCSWEVPSTFKGLRISRVFGREGSLTFESNGLFIAVNGRRKRMLFPGVADIAGYKGMFRDFLGCLRTGAEPRMTLDMAEQDVRRVEEAYRTAETGAPALPREAVAGRGVSSLRA